MIIKHKNPMGLAASLNEDIEISKGKYIARMDSDDVAKKTRIKEQVNYMEKNNEIDITATYYQEMGQSNKKVLEKFYKSEEVKAKLFYINIILHPSVMIKKEFIEKYQIRYDIKYIYSQDYELWTRINKVCKMEIIPKIEMYYRIHSSQISSSKFQVQSKLYYEILKRNLKELNLEESDLKYLLMLNFREKNINIKELEKFIYRALKNNEIINLYNQKNFAIILKTAFLKALIKNKKILNYEFFKNIKYFKYIF